MSSGEALVNMQICEISSYSFLFYVPPLYFMPSINVDQKWLLLTGKRGWELAGDGNVVRLRTIVPCCNASCMVRPFHWAGFFQNIYFFSILLLCLFFFPVCSPILFSYGTHEHVVHYHTHTRCVMRFFFVCFFWVIPRTHIFFSVIHLFSVTLNDLLYWLRKSKWRCNERDLENVLRQQPRLAKPQK